MSDDDDEDDYMNMTFGEEEEQQAAPIVVPQKRRKIDLERERLREGLSRPVSGLGFKLLAKSTKGGAEAIQQQSALPAVPEMRMGKLGVGLGEELRKDMHVLPAEDTLRIYHAQLAEERTLKRLKGDTRKALLAAARLDGPLVPHSAFCQFEEEMLLLKKAPTYQKWLESALGSTRERRRWLLRATLDYLRATYCYCLYCGAQYQSQQEMQEMCPGEDRAAHDE